MFRALMLASALIAQGAVPAGLKDAVWDAVHPALPFPAANVRHEPIDGGAAARWIVRRADADEGTLVAEVIANPINRDNQKQAEADMAAIQKEVVAAERRAQIEFERAIDDVHVSGQARTIRGITLDDEGMAGEKADAESGMTIEVLSTREVAIEAAEAPTLHDSAAGSPWIVRVPARIIEKTAGGSTASHYRPAEAMVCLSSVKPTFGETSRRVFTVRVASSVNVIVLRGNADLIDSVIARANWAQMIAGQR